MFTSQPAKRARLLLPNPEVWKTRRPKLYQPPRALREHLQLVVPALLMVLVVQGLVLWQLLQPVTPLVSVPRIFEESELRIELNSLNFEPPPPPPPPPPRDKAERASSAAPPPIPAAVREAAALASRLQPAPSRTAPAPKVPAVAVLSMPTPPAPTPIARLSIPTLSLAAPAALTTEQQTEEQGITESGIDQSQARVAPLRLIAKRAVENPSPLIPLPTLLPPLSRPEPAVAIAFVPLTPERVRPTPQTPATRPVPLLVDEPTPPMPTPVRIATTVMVKPQIEPIALQTPRLEVAPAAPQAPSQAAIAPLKIDKPERSSQVPRVAAPSLSALNQTAQPAPALEAAVPLSAKAEIAPSGASLSVAEPLALIAFTSEPSVAPPVSEGEGNAAQDSPSQDLAESIGSLVADPFAGEATRPGQAGGLPSADDLLGAIGGAAREQVASQGAARGDGRLPWRRYDDPFIDELPGRLAGLRLREPALFNEISRFLVRTLSQALLGAALGVSEEYDDSAGTNLGPLIDLWLRQHHGDLGLACRQAAGMTAAAREILCKNVAP